MNENILKSTTLVESEHTRWLKHSESRSNMRMCEKKTLRDLKHSRNQMLGTDSILNLVNVYHKIQIKAQVNLPKRQLVELV